MADAPPPDPDYVAAIYARGVGDARRRRASTTSTRRPAARAARRARGCRRGSACSTRGGAAMSTSPRRRAALAPRSAGVAARRAASSSAHFAVRRAVFVDAQALFEGDDRDERDDDAGHAARGRPRSTARSSARCGCTRSDDGLWKGDRLAVLPEARVRRSAAELVRFAVAHGGRARRPRDGRADPAAERALLRAPRLARGRRAGRLPRRHAPADGDRPPPRPVSGSRARSHTGGSRPRARAAGRGCRRRCRRARRRGRGA